MKNIKKGKVELDPNWPYVSRADIVDFFESHPMFGEDAVDNVEINKGRFVEVDISQDHRAIGIPNLSLARMNLICSFLESPDLTTSVFVDGGCAMCGYGGDEGLKVTIFSPKLEPPKRWEKPEKSKPIWRIKR